MSYSSGVAKKRLLTASLHTDPHLALLQRIAKKDEDALDELYRRVGPGLLGYLIGRLQDAHLAEEVLQDVMLVAWRNAPRFRGDCRVLTWLLTIARNRAINAYHRQIVPAAHNVPFDDLDLDKIGQASLSVEPASVYHDLNAAFQELPEEQRETLELVFYHGLSQEEVAQVLNIAPGTVKSRLHRAKDRLRAWMNAESQAHELPPR